MCKKCRDKIRERAISAQMAQENIPLEMRAIFERGAKFGELQAALFLETSTRVGNDMATPIIALLEALGDKDAGRELETIKTMEAIYKHQFKEGAELAFGKPSPESKDKVNVLREIHDLPLMDIGHGAEPQGRKDPTGDLLAEIKSSLQQPSN